ncbi:uncharacterized protein BYT42DRAFT_649161 [Radiomyces spectabilis]|uniref:uncharacterized protein n=1 Tax=Radiomyces spectabilis TaxID=64574 RepID=UPI0022202CB2|nr:uncharacterized protein BYT42DRAFT_649161 [Radiomyces spectabilis]KAI8365233.1 hypothetical protein BYT42DRAFT_649161 [Radiomyces spectabilis]
MQITRDQAICMLFYVEYTDENLRKYKERLDELKEFELCYNVDPKEPILVSKLRVYGNPLIYRKYIESIDDVLPPELKKRTFLLQTEAQVIQYINEVYKAEDPSNPAYALESLATKDIFLNMCEHTGIFDDKSLTTFTRWCSINRLEFLNVTEERKRNVRFRDLYVLNHLYQDSLVAAIVQYLSNYQNSLRHLKSEGFEIVGYARKSPNDDDPDRRARLLQSMITNLRTRSLCTRIYVSSSSRASDPFHERDLNPNMEVYEKLHNINGNTQDMLQYFQASESKLCLVSIDFTGLSSKSHHIKKLLEENSSIAMIAVELFNNGNTCYLLEANRLVSNNELLAKFDCRPKLIQRSL